MRGCRKCHVPSLRKGSRIVQIAPLLEQARGEAAHVRRAARHHDELANEHVDTLSALIDKTNEPPRNLRNPDRRKANVMEHLLDQLNGAIDGIASCLADPIHDEWFQTGKATQTLKEAARRLNDIAHGIQIERDQYLEFMSE